MIDRSKLGAEIKLAVVCPVGPLDRFGYQNVAEECIGSMAAFGDAVYLISSTREDERAKEIGAEHENVTVFSNDRTWFRGSAVELFDVYKIIANIGYGISVAFEDGADCIVKMECNQYIPKRAWGGLRKICKQVWERCDPFGWYYRRDFLAGQMFHASTKRPWIFPHGTKWSVWLDSVRCGKEIVRHERGNWPEEDGSAIVDAQLEMTLEDYEAKLNFIRCYSDLEPSRDSKFNWGYWHDYMLRKFRAKERGGDLDEIGEKLMEKVRPDFVSKMILEELDETA